MIDARLGIALGVGPIIGAVAIGLTLSQSPLTVVRANTVAHSYVGSTNRTTTVCQANELIPQRVSAVRLRAFAFLGPRVTLDVLAHGRVLAKGERGSGWTGNAVTVPVSRMASATSTAELCFTFFIDGDEYDEFAGEPERGRHAPRGSLHGRVRVEYLRPDGPSWWSLAPAVARRMSLGRGWPGRGSVPLVLALMGGVLLLSSRLIVRAPGSAASRSGRDRGSRER